MCQYIKDGYKNKKLTGVAFVNLSAVYDTVNHNLLLKKIYEYTNYAPCTSNILYVTQSTLYSHVEQYMEQMEKRVNRVFSG